MRITPYFFSTMRRAAARAVKKVRTRVAVDRGGEALERELRDGNPLGPRLRDRCDGVERDIDRPRPLHHCAYVILHGLLVEGVDLRRLCNSASGEDVLHDLVDRGEDAAS